MLLNPDFLLRAGNLGVAVLDERFQFRNPLGVRRDPLLMPVALVFQFMVVAHRLIHRLFNLAQRPAQVGDLLLLLRDLGVELLGLPLSVKICASRFVMSACNKSNLCRASRVSSAFIGRTTPCSGGPCRPGAGG